MTRRGRSRSPFSLFSFQDIITCVSGIIILITLVLALELSQRTQASPQAQTSNIAAQLRAAIDEAQAEIARLEIELRQKSSVVQERSSVSPSEMRRDRFAIAEQIASLEAELASLRNQEQTISRTHENVQAKLFDRQKSNDEMQREERKIKDLEEKLDEVRNQNRLYYNARTADGKQVWLVQVEANRILVAAAGAPAKPIVFSEWLATSRRAAFDRWLSTRSKSSDFVFLLFRAEGVSELPELKNTISRLGFSFGFDLLGPEQTAIDPEKGAAGI